MAYADFGLSRKIASRIFNNQNYPVGSVPYIRIVLEVVTFLA